MAGLFRQFSLCVHDLFPESLTDCCQNELSRERAERGKVEALARVEAKARQRAEADTIDLMRLPFKTLVPLV